MYFWCFCFRGELGFLNCDDVCMCVVNKQFELLEVVSESIYVDLQYDEISRGCCGDCDACTVVCVACVCAVRVCEGDGSAGVGSG